MIDNTVLRSLAIIFIVAVLLLLLLEHYYGFGDRPDEIITDQQYLVADIVEVKTIKMRVSRCENCGTYNNYYVKVRLPDGRQATVVNLTSPEPKVGQRMPLVYTLYYDGSKSLTVDVPKWRLSGVMPIK